VFRINQLTRRAGVPNPELASVRVHYALIVRAEDTFFKQFDCASAMP